MFGAIVDDVRVFYVVCDVGYVIFDFGNYVFCNYIFCDGFFCFFYG